MNGASCRYKLMFPHTAAEYDQIVLKVTKLSDTKLFSVSSMSYQSERFIETQAKEGEIVKVDYPNVMFVTV